MVEYKNKINIRRRRFAIVISSILAVLLIVGGIFAKYRVDHNKEAEMIANNFHFSSNYLEVKSSKVNLSVTDWTDGVKIEVYNYEKENPELKSSTDIRYTINIPDDFEIKVTNGSEADSVEILPNLNGEYTLEKVDGKDSVHILNVKPMTGTTIESDETIKISVKAVAPFTKELAGDVSFSGSAEFDYTVQRLTNNGDYYLLTLKTNHFSGDLNINWPQELVVDNTNEKMLSWRGNNGVFSQAESFSTYELMFFNPTGAAFEKADFTVAFVG